MSTTRPRDRWIAALAIGAATAFLHSTLRDPTVAPDLAPVWWSARALMSGMNPYTAVGPEGTLFHYPYAQLYPLHAILLLVPLTWVTPEAATAIFTGVSASALAFAVARDGFARLPIFVSAAFVWSVSLAQWGPLLTAAALVPPLGFLLVAKPTIGLALLAYRPSRVAVIGGAILVLASLAVWPTWPAWWIPILREHAPRMVAPIAVPGGVLLLLALLRWKRPEARLLIALAFVPQTPIPYECVVLFLIASTFLEASVLAAATWVFAELLIAWIPQDVSTPEKRQYAMQLMLATVYLPALVMLLRRPNEGDTADVARAIFRPVLAFTRASRARAASSAPGLHSPSTTPSHAWRSNGAQYTAGSLRRAAARSV